MSRIAPSSKLAPARRLALSVLAESQQRDGFVRDILDASGAMRHLDARDAGFARRLVLGVTSTEGCLDELVDRFLAKPNKVAPRVRVALRIAAFELLYLGTPPEVAVSQGVELVRSQARNAAGLANAVLRKVASASTDYLGALDVIEERPALVAAARTAGLPLWLATYIVDSIGFSCAADLFAAQLDPAPNAIHVNARRAIDADDLRLVSDDSYDGGASLPGCVAPAAIAAGVSSGAFDRADIVASDVHAQLIATAATRPGSCLEIGAGRGTKTFIMACQAQRAGYAHNHVALDLYEGKCRQNLERLKRAGLSADVRTVAGDACDLDAALAAYDAEADKRVVFDTVFVDAPCSGTGTMRRHPEIPWRLAPQDVNADLPHLQLTMLKQAAARVGAGGELIYATCSVLQQENNVVVEAFLASDEGMAFRLAPPSQADIFCVPSFAGAVPIFQAHESEHGLFQTVPALGAFDGHFCARFCRR